MALSIVNNPLSIGAQGSVNGAQNGLSKTIKSLSTGLRINSAADDASGLAVSEKLRSQISGLSKAATNAQDAISMLQTAEGAMGSMTSMVQRIRELAVQAGDPAYTANDRAMLQLEVDQLKEEIDRVSSSTEFNTKKLLNGDAAALWTSSTNDLEAIVKGAAVEGNYKVTYNIDPGQNSVYKSNIMRLGEGQYSYDINSNNSSITKIDNISGMMREGNVNLTIATGSQTYEVDAIGSQITASGTNGATDYYRVTDGVITGNSTILVDGVTATITYDGGSNFTITFANGDTAKLTAGGTLEFRGISFTLSTASKTVTMSSNNHTIMEQLTAGSTLLAGDIYHKGATGDTDVTYIGGTGAFVKSSSISFDAKSYVGDGYFEMEAVANNQIKIRFRDAHTGELSEWQTITINSSGETQNGTAFFSAGTTLFAKGTKFNVGDKALIATSNDAINLEVKNEAYSGVMTSVQFGNGPKIDLTTDKDFEKKHTIFTGQIDKSGNVYWGQMDVTLARGSSEKNTISSSGTMNIDVLGAGDVASKYTKLSQLAQFTNSDGRMVLDNTQEISIYAGNGKTAKVTLQGADTIADLEKKLNSALMEQLDLGTDDKDVNNNLVKFVETPGKGDRAVQGTFVIQGAKLGADSNLTFVGDDAVLKALGITQIQEAKESAMHVTVTDAHTGKFIGEDKVTDGRVRNIIPGVDIDINATGGVDMFFDGATNSIKYEPKGTNETAFLHIKDSSTKAAIGANEGQTLDLSIGRLDTKSLEITDVNVATFEDAQKSITKLDMALEQISKARSTAGAQMNRLEHTINNLNTTRENMTAAESRIRDLDIAQASSSLAAQQVLMQSASAMLAQANQMPSYAMQLIG